MTPQRFSHLLVLVGPAITRQDTIFRQAIPPDERLAITLRYLVTGDSMQTISFRYRVGHSTVSGIINSTCESLWNVLLPRYMRRPSMSAESRRANELFMKSIYRPVACNELTIVYQEHEELSKILLA